jgi:hypothetical protein
MDTSTLTATAVPIQESFTAFTASLNYIPVDLTLLLQSDHLQKKDVDKWPLKIFDPSHANSSFADPFVNSLVWSLTSPLPSENPAQHLRGFLAHALVRNSGFVNGTILRDNAYQTYILSIDLRGIKVYAVLNGIVICLTGFMVLRRLTIPEDTQLFHELAVGNREAVIELLTENTVIKRVRVWELRDYRLEVAPRVVNNWEWRPMVRGVQRRGNTLYANLHEFLKTRIYYI